MTEQEMIQRILNTLKRRNRETLSYQELVRQAGIRNRNLPLFKDSLKALLQSGEVFQRKQRYARSRNWGFFPAKITKVNGTFGFAYIEEDQEEIFIPGRGLKGALPGDTVLLKKEKGFGELSEGAVQEFISQPEFTFTGVVLELGGLFVAPDKDIRCHISVQGADIPVVHGNKVMAVISKRGSDYRRHKARILKVFGSADSASSCCEAIIASAGLEREFPEMVLQEADAASAMGIHPKEAGKRLDLRDQAIFTIDGADTKDIDDAISLEKLEDGGWKLGVHIADVSYYVPMGGELDRCAYTRGTSVYFADSVIPMLPPVLSNGICSLNPQEDRLAFSALMTLDEKGKLREYQFEKTIIRSRVKGVYAEVNQILNGTADQPILDKYQEVTGEIQLMSELAGLLQARRKVRGSVDLQSMESKIILDDQGKAVDVTPRVQGQSEGIIEEFMLTANEAAALTAVDMQLPFVYRIHETPSPERLNSLAEMLDNIGVDSSGLRNDPSPAKLSAVLERLKDTDVFIVVNAMILRSMAKARYSEENKGHYGLALGNYTHFTSPIRRYPDLAIHRVLSACYYYRKQNGGEKLSEEKLHKLENKFGKFVEEAAAASSAAEVRAMNVERSCVDCYKAEYVSQHIGETFDGLISSVAGHGIYITLPNTVEGLVRVDALPPGDYQADGNIQMVETHTGKKYRVGDHVKIRIDRADISAGQVDFSLIVSEG